MKLNTTPENQVTMGNISYTGEFKIRNSAKAFKILSDGLYANKIRAAIRELACNAVDSHVAAGKADLPFDVHLPTSFAPHFAIRDYGIGLNHDQVINIYTTYFESTKTDSNDFIGALGLGSKSPFSYTDNFTVTAVKDGMRRIYSAFINDSGVPSVAMMSEEESDEATGVEVRFAVDNRNDFYRFRDEAATVFTHFKVLPTFTGAQCNVVKYEYETLNIVPGVNSRKGRSDNVAVMGHIEYPIDLPDSQQLLGNVSHIDAMGLELRFEIGEIDFQASREGLQYTKETTAAILKKYREVAEVLNKTFEDMAAKHTNVWDLKNFLIAQNNSRVWVRSAQAYIKKHKPALVSCQWDRIQATQITIPEKTLINDCNIEIKAFRYEKWGDRTSEYNVYDYYRGNVDSKVQISPDYKMVIIPNHKGEKIYTRVRYHAKTHFTEDQHIYVLNKVDDTKDMDVAKFMTLMHNPPTSMQLDVANLDKVKRTPSDAEKSKVNIMHLEYDRYKSNRSDSITWQASGALNTFDTTTTYYYINLKGFVATTQQGVVVDAKDIYYSMMNSNMVGLANTKVYGVRKGDLETVQQLPNWKPLEELITPTITAITPERLTMGFMPGISQEHRGVYVKQVSNKVHADSPFRKLVDCLDTAISIEPSHVKKLCATFAPTVDLDALTTKAKAMPNEVYARYPMLTMLDNQRYRKIDYDIISHYINLVDEGKTKDLKIV